MREHIKSVVALTVITAVVAVLLAMTNFITEPIIAENQAAAANAALLEVMPNGEGFEAIDISAYELPASVTGAYKEANGGYVLQTEVTGYSSGMVIVCGVDASGTVTGATCLSSGETLGYEKTFGANLVGKTSADVDAVDTVGGATKTTAAYKTAVKDSLNAAIILGGGSVDIRTEEEILQDAFRELLPAGEIFVPTFITEDLPGILSVYTAANGAGAIYVVGEAAIFVAVDANGNVLTETDDATKTLVADAAAKMLASSMEEIDITAYADMPAAVQKAYKTESGNFVIEVRGSGFGITGDKYYNPSGEYIYIRASVTPDGRIIAVETLSQAETDGIGSACADPAFYTQFNGKTETNYKEIDGISGATKTTNGYTTAILRVFEAVKLLKGDA